MKSLSAQEVLRIWEQGQGQRPVDRALALLGAACPETSPDELARLSIGQRDARLLTLREWMFGPQLVSTVACPNCSEALELTLNTADIRTQSEAEPAGPLALTAAGYEVMFRLPNSLDLASVTGNGDVEETRRWLLERCVLSASENSASKSADQLPVNVAEAVVAQMAQADPQADVQVAVTCPACGHPWQATFDIVTFFWIEINAWAYRILSEIHTLALAYGWSEADILALSPWRRQFYLEMLSG
jgi:hypothetical protein